MIRRTILGAALVASCACAVACGGASAQPPLKGAAKVAPVEVAPRFTPVPETLAFEAGLFGLSMSGEGWTWKVLRRDITRFDWSGRPTKGDRELLYSFWTERLDETSAKLLPQVAQSAAANLSETEPCRPVEQPAEIARALGVDRVVSVCFEPSTFYGAEFKTGVLHALVHRNALTLAVVLSNDKSPTAPSASSLGTRGAPPR